MQYILPSSLLEPIYHCFAYFDFMEVSVCVCVCGVCVLERVWVGVSELFQEAKI